MKALRKKKLVGCRKRPHKSGASFNSSSLSRRKLWCFRFLFAIGVPLAFLGTLGLVLRFIGFGYPTEFFLPSQHDGKKVLVQNNQFGWRFFGKSMARIPEPVCLPEIKGYSTPFASSFLENQPRWEIHNLVSDCHGC